MKLYIKFGEDISIGSKVISIVLLILYRRTDGQTDGRTDKVSHRGAPLLKILLGTKLQWEITLVTTISLKS